MASSIGISVQAFTQWGLQPVAKIGREAFYTVDQVIQFREDRLAKKLGQQDNQPAGAIEKLLADPNLAIIQRAEILKVQKLEEETRRLKLQNAVLEGRSIPAWGVTEVLSKILSRAGEIFDGLPLKVKRKYPNIDKRVVEMIKAEVVKADNEVARLGEFTDEIIAQIVLDAEDRIR